MAHKCFISFKTEDIEYKSYIQKYLAVDIIDKSLDDAIDSEDEDYIMRKIREDYLSDSTVTVHLIGAFSSENRGTYEQRYIKRELQASIYNGEGNTRNGILGVVLPSAVSQIYLGVQRCVICGGSHNVVKIDNTTTVKEFSYNYYLPNDKCAWTEDDRYCVLVKWDEFIVDPEPFIEQAFKKRTHATAEKVKMKPD